MLVKPICLLLLFFLGASLFLASTASATPVLYDWSANINGATFNPPALPGSVDSTGFDFATGLGTMTMTFAAGTHYGGVYLNIYFDSGLGFVSDAYGAVGGAASSLESYQLADPNLGQLWLNFVNNALDGTNTVSTYSPPGPPPGACCDVGLALIRRVTVNAGNTGSLTFVIGTSQPSSGFFLMETSHDSGETVYLSESFTQSEGPQPAIPEPATWLLMSSGVVLLALSRRKKQSKQ